MKQTKWYCFIHILLPLFITCTGWNMVRRALGESAPNVIKQNFMNQANYATLNTSAFIVYGISKFVTSHVVKGNLFLLYTILFGIVGFMCSCEGFAASPTTGSFRSFFFLWVLNYMFMGTLWPIICIVFKQWVPDDCSLVSHL